MSKPKFDPSKPFEAVGESKPKFDPNAPFEEASENVVEQPRLDSGEVVGRGMLQGASGGLSDEASGVIDAAAQNTFLEKLPEVAKVGLSLGFPMGVIAENIKQLTTGEKTFEDLKASYVAGREISRDNNRQAQEQDPALYTVSNIAGSIISPANKAVQGASLLKQGATLGGLYGFGTSEGEGVVDTALDTAKGAALGGAIGGTLSAAKPLISKASNAIGGKLGKSAEKFAETATGATRVQAEKFKPGTGRTLLDDGLVQFGDDAEKIAERSSAAIQKAESGIDDALTALDKKGVKISNSDIILKLQEKVAALKKDPSQADVVRKVESIIEDISATGDESVSPAFAEKIKRGFNKISKNWMDPNQGQAGKTAYLAYRDSVEEAAKKADPEIFSKFVDSKQTFGKLVPVVDAAEKRALQLNQSPIGGLLDTASFGAGALSPGGLAAGAATSVGRRMVSPRLASSLAVTTDKLSKGLKGVAPQASQSTERIASITAIDSLRDSAKGIDRWILNGVKKVAGIDQNLDPEFLMTLKSSKQGKDALIRASELDPKSAQMQRIVNQIKSSKEYQEFQKQKEKQAQGKEPDQSSVKPKTKFPKVVLNGEYSAVVRNEKELKEAISEGWA